MMSVKQIENIELLNTNYFEQNQENLLYLWKRRKPSPGYNRSYFAEFPDGAKAIVEYNFIRETVKIEFYPADEYRHFYVVIQRGSIIQEREFQSNRSVSLYSRLGKYKKFFSYLIDEQVLKTIGGNYGIPLESAHPNATSDFNILQLKKKYRWIRPKRWLDRIQNYLKQKEQRQKNLQTWKKALYRMPGDILDSSIIFFLFYLFYSGKITSAAFSFWSILYSITTGFIDDFWRRRKPSLIKTMILTIPGILIFWFQYQLYEWGIFEPANQKLAILIQILKHSKPLSIIQSL